MVIQRWDSEIQRAISGEWVEGCQTADGRQSKRILRKRIGEKYGLTSSIIQAIVELTATQGLNRTKSKVNKTDGHGWELIDYYELIGNLKGRVGDIEKKFEFLLDGIQKVLEDSEAMAAHIGHLRKMGGWMKKRGVLDMRELTQVPPELPTDLKEVSLPSGELDEDEPPYLAEIGSENTISDRKAVDVPPKDEWGKKRGEIKPKTRATYDELDPLAKIERLRNQVDNARKRGELLFRGIEEGKKALPRQGKRPTSP